MDEVFGGNPVASKVTASQDVFGRSISGMEHRMTSYFDTDPTPGVSDARPWGLLRVQRVCDELSESPQTFEMQRIKANIEAISAAAFFDL
jgi:hypothetical protein